MDGDLRTLAIVHKDIMFVPCIYLYDAVCIQGKKLHDFVFLFGINKGWRTTVGLQTDFRRNEQEV